MKIEAMEIKFKTTAELRKMTQRQRDAEWNRLERIAVKFDKLMEKLEWAQIQIEDADEEA